MNIVINDLDPIKVLNKHETKYFILGWCKFVTGENPVSYQEAEDYFMQQYTEADDRNISIDCVEWFDEFSNYEVRI